MADGVWRLIFDTHIKHRILNYVHRINCHSHLLCFELKINCFVAVNVLYINILCISFGLTGLFLRITPCYAWFPKTETLGINGQVFYWRSLIVADHMCYVLLFWHAPLGVRSAIRRRQPPQMTLLGQVDGFVQLEVVGSQVSLDSVQPCDMRTPWWSLPGIWLGSR